MKIQGSCLLLIIPAVFLLIAIIQLAGSDYAAGNKTPNSKVHSVSQATQQYYQQKHTISELTLAQSYARWKAKDAVFVDARTQEMYDDAHIPAALNLPVDTLYDRFEDFSTRVDAAYPVIVYCSSDECIASGIVASYLIDQGYSNVSHFGGGLLEWENNGYPVETQE